MEEALEGAVEMPVMADSVVAVHLVFSSHIQSRAAQPRSSSITRSNEALGGQVVMGVQGEKVEKVDSAKRGALSALMNVSVFWRAQILVAVEVMGE